jgi:putative ABC transport system permease protein
LWRRAFGGARDVIGRKVIMDTDPYTVVGVMPADFRHPGETVRGDVDMWSACGFAATPFPSQPRRERNFIPGVMGRLRPGISLQHAQDRLNALSAQLQATYPSNYPANVGWSLRLEDVQGELTQRIRPTLRVLMGAVGLLLVIACVNIANLTLARSSSRVREIAVRRALGATRAQLVRQLLVESLIVAIAGGAAALVALAWAKDWIVSLMPADLPRLAEVRFDGGMIAMGLALSVLAGLLFGIVPAIQVSGVNLGNHLKDAGRGRGEGRGERRFRGALVSAEIAISLVLLVGAGLLVRSFWSMLQVNPGLDPRQVGFAQIWIPVPNDPSKNPYATPAQRSAYVNEVIRRVAELPGVEAVGMSASNRTPFSGSGVTQRFAFVGESDAPADLRRAQFQVASPDYFTTLRAPILSGRAFTPGDVPGSEPVAIVNQTLAKTQSPGKDPVGRSLALGRQSVRIVGVIADVKDHSLTEPAWPRIYFAYAQHTMGWAGGLRLIIRTAGPPNGVVPQIRPILGEADSRFRNSSAVPVADLMRDSVAQERLLARLASGFGLMALLLAAIGLYGVMTYAVTRRTAEIGLRVALGADGARIVRMVLRDAMSVVLVGVVVGIPIALGAAGLLKAQLYGVTTTDPLSITVAVVVMATSAALAALAPALRASRVAPLLSLRQD